MAIIELDSVETSLVKKHDTEIIEPAFKQTPENIQALKNQIMPRGSTDDQLKMFLHVIKTTNLDPFNRQIYAIPTAGKITYQTSIDGFRLIAQRSGVYAGQIGPFWCGDDGVWCDVWLKSDLPAAAKVGVIRKGFSEPIYGVAILRERKGTTPMWNKMPTHMLAKVAESLALRKAFPNELSGLQTKEEMEDCIEVESSVTTESSAEVQNLIREILKLVPIDKRAETLPWISNKMGVANIDELENRTGENLEKTIQQLKQLKDVLSKKEK